MDYHSRRILLTRRAQSVNAYAQFLLEILTAEGLTGFDVHDLDDSAVPGAGPGDLIVLSRCRLAREEVGRLHAAAEAGATVVVVHPSFNVAERFGWRLSPTLSAEGWVSIAEGRPGCGLPVQTHVPVIGTEAIGDQEVDTVAWGVDSGWTATGMPAVTTQGCGRGNVAIWWFDVAKAVARIRFGDPDLADTVGNGHWRWPHALDLFVGHVDDRVAHLPQADFHGQLLADVVTDLLPIPLARLWYYPEAVQRTGAVFQSDDDGSEPHEFEALVGALEKNGGRGTFYMMEETKLSDDRLAEWKEAGHSFGPHVDAWHGKWGADVDIWFDFPQQLERQTAAFRRRYGHCSSTLQSHKAPWLEYMSAVPMHMEQDYRLLFAYLSGPQKMINKFMCGSGRPMPFCDLDGTVYGCWQQPLPTFDDTSLQERIGSEPDAVFAEFDGVFTDALERTHTSIAMLSHPVSFYTYSQPFVERCFERLSGAGVPIWNADAWLQFHERRHCVGVRQASHGDGAHTITVSGLVGRLPLMIPAESGEIEVCVGDEAVEVLADERLGRGYAFVQLENDDPDRDVVVRAKFLSSR